MKKDNSYTEYIVYDVLGHIDGLSTKKMFSGTGVYLDGVIVVFIIRGELYFKCNKELKDKYLKEDTHLFAFEKNGKNVQLSYISVTEDMIENRDMMTSRIYESYDISNKNK